LSPEQLADPAGQAAQYRIPLLNQVTVLGDPPEEARKRTVRWASRFLLDAQEKLVAGARQDQAALDQWRTVVGEGKAEFDRRYRREFLTGEKFRRFDEALVRLLELLELPGAGQVVSNVLRIIRTPYRLLRGLVVKAMTRPEAPSMPEQPVMEEALSGWLDLLRKEAARRVKSHPLWAYIDRGFASGLADMTRQRFQEGLSTFRVGLADEVDHTARAIYEDLEKNPGALNVLRGGKLTLDVAAIVAAVATGGAHWALDVILVPVAASVSHQLVELVGKQYVDGQREHARDRQQALVSEHLSGPLAQWLGEWPATGGSAFEQMGKVLARIPDAVRKLDQAVAEKTAAPSQAPGGVGNIG
jgi:hypothetical protein